MINNILEDREKRYEKILMLAKQYNLPVLCGKINYAGENKNTIHSDFAFNILWKLLTTEFEKEIIYDEKLVGYDGKAYIIVLKCDINIAKQKAVDIEKSHVLGRIFDIDVYNVDGEPISRVKFGNNIRKCIICKDDAKVCARTKKHSVQDVIDKINNIIDEFGEKYGRKI